MYVFAGRTGSATETALIDNICINDYSLGPIGLVVTPQNPTVTECSPSLLTANVTGSPPYYYQWLSNGVAIAGATGATYTPVLHCPRTTSVTYSCHVHNDFSSASANNSVSVLCSDKTAECTAFWSFDE